jgi:hypothetical protein
MLSIFQLDIAATADVIAITDVVAITTVILDHKISLLQFSEL